MVAIIVILLSISTYPSASADPIWIKCASPSKVTATELYGVNCASNVQIDGVKAHLQWVSGDGATNKSNWQDAAEGTYAWIGNLLVFNRIYKDPKASGIFSFRLVTDFKSQLFSKTYSNIWVIQVEPLSGVTSTVSTTSKSSTSATTTSKPRFVTVPNFVGLPVKWLQTHHNAFPGIRFSITGSSCSISDLLSGNAMIISQYPEATLKRPYNTFVTLKTNC